MKHTCPCCGYRTMDNDGEYEICPICFWEDDPFQKVYVYDIGANKVPLIEAQVNYMKYYVCEKQFTINVRKPNEQDKRDPNWKPVHDDMYQLRLICRKFKEGIYNIEEVSRSLSKIKLPFEISELVKQAEYELEMIRFCTSDYNQYAEALGVVERLLGRLNITLEDKD